VNSEILSANVYIHYTPIYWFGKKKDVTFADKEAKIEANPCLEQPSIKVKLQLILQRVFFQQQKTNHK